jgi:hypothetical protein
MNEGGKRAELCDELAAFLVQKEFVTAERQADLAAAIHEHITSFTSLSENEQLFWESGHWFSIGRVRPQTARIVVAATTAAAAAMWVMGYDPQVR